MAYLPTVPTTKVEALASENPICVEGRLAGCLRRGSWSTLSLIAGATFCRRTCISSWTKSSLVLRTPGWCPMATS